MSESDDDRIARLADHLAGLSAEELRDDAQWEGLSDDDRKAVVAYSEQKAAHLFERAEAQAVIGESFHWAAHTDPLKALDLGWELITALGEATEPVGLLAWIDRIAAEERRDVVCALFAAVVHDMCSELNDREAPAAIKEVERQWYAQPRTADEPRHPTEEARVTTPPSRRRTCPETARLMRAALSRA